MLDDPEWEVQRYTISALGKIGVIEAIPLLEKKLESENPAIRHEVQEALNTLRSLR
jgi:HEAT repeat protein